MKSTKLLLTPLYALLILIVLPNLGSCTKEDMKCNGCECQFPVSETGENTFSCKIEGEPWSACTKVKGNVLGGGNNNPIEFFWDQDNGWKYIKLTSHRYIKKSTETIQILLNEPKLGILSIDNIGNSGICIYLDSSSIHNPGIQGIYCLEKEKPFTLHIMKLDLQERIISGTFEGNFFDSLEKKYLKVTDSQFDIKF